MTHGNYAYGLPKRFQIDVELSCAGARSLDRTFRATDRETGEQLVLKSIRYPLWFGKKDQAAHQSRLASALRSVAAVQSFSLANLFEVSEGENGLFMAREWIAGMPLSTFVQEIRQQQIELPTYEVSRIAGQCAAALDALAAVGLRHGALTADNVIVSENGSIKLTDAGFSEAAGNFNFGGTTCRLKDGRGGLQPGTDISRLADLLLWATDATEVHSGQPARDRQEELVRKRMLAALRHARKDDRAYPTAASLAEALTEMNSATIVRHVWRPATTSGLLAAFSTVCVFAVSENRPAVGHRKVVQKHELSIQMRQPQGPSLAALSSEENSLLGLMIRRQGIAVLTRPDVADLFQLDAGQRVALQNILHTERERLAQMVEHAAMASATSEQGDGQKQAAVVTHSLRESATEGALTLLTPAQHEMWSSLAKTSLQAPAAGEPIL